MGPDAFGNRLATFDFGVLHVDSADAELPIAEVSFEMMSHVVLDEIGGARDLADKIGLVTADIEITMADLSVVFLADRIVALADMHRHMNLVGNAVDREV